MVREREICFPREQVSRTLHSWPLLQIAEGSIMHAPHIGILLNCPTNNSDKQSTDKCSNHMNNSDDYIYADLSSL
jgi:hypothetical protein